MGSEESPVQVRQRLLHRGLHRGLHGGLHRGLYIGLHGGLHGRKCVGEGAAMLLLLREDELRAHGFHQVQHPGAAATLGVRRRRRENGGQQQAVAEVRDVALGGGLVEEGLLV